MNRASAPDLRKAMVFANAFKAAGILFVPMPVMDEADHAVLKAGLIRRMEMIEKAAEQEAP